jgi:hypothetical protein
MSAIIASPRTRQKPQIHPRNRWEHLVTVLACSTYTSFGKRAFDLVVGFYVFLRSHVVEIVFNLETAIEMNRELRETRENKEPKGSFL